MAERRIFHSHHVHPILIRESWRQMPPKFAINDVTDATLSPLLPTPSLDVMPPLSTLFRTPPPIDVVCGKKWPKHFKEIRIATLKPRLSQPLMTDVAPTLIPTSSFSLPQFSFRLSYSIKSSGLFHFVTRFTFSDVSNKTIQFSGVQSTSNLYDVKPMEWRGKKCFQ